LGKQLSFFTLITIKKNGYGRKTYSRNIVESGFKLHEPNLEILIDLLFYLPSYVLIGRERITLTQPLSD
jgi:hypothetical protein